MLSWFENHMLPCAWKSLLGIDCPACGLQRSCIQLMKGNFRESLVLYPPLPAVLLLLVFSGIYLLNRQAISKKFFASYSWIVLAIVFMNYVVKLIFLQP